MFILLLTGCDNAVVSIKVLEKEKADCVVFVSKTKELNVPKEVYGSSITRKLVRCKELGVE